MKLMMYTNLPVPLMHFNGQQLYVEIWIADSFYQIDNSSKQILWLSSLKIGA